MPVSTSIHVSHCLQLILNLAPKSVLDVGCGFGMWGFLCREYLDVAAGRVQPEEWQVRIDGLEVFEPYIQAHQRAIYSSIRIADLRDAVSDIDEYDLIIAGDVIEHLDKDEGLRVVELLHKKAMRALLVNIPLGEGWEHPEAYGNPAELHRSQWFPKDFAPYNPHFERFDLPCGAYGSFFMPTDRRRIESVNRLLETARKCEDSGDLDNTIRCLKKAYKLAPESRELVASLGDVLLKTSRVDETLDLLTGAVGRDPGFHQAYMLAANLLVHMGREAEAVQYLEALLARDDMPAEIRAVAEVLLGQLAQE